MPMNMLINIMNRVFILNAVNIFYIAYNE